ncbi:uncharacterized protein TrAFT101_005407 [Trichoderma asperellum]|uniref:uncharacterized protein n=1 Tax=Trichoderma asperellum TaxID=101201 RepID=UPI00331ACCAE|nr:hypothetical protein TrAFT101_005407 [Trichoderma asperellum]
MDPTSWLDLSVESDGITSPSPPPSPPISPAKLLSRSKSIIERSSSRASVYSISPNTSSRSDDHLLGRAGLPPWDRTVDIIYHKYKRGEAKPDRNAALKASQKFPDNVRLLILRNLVASHEPLGSKPISLNRFCWDQDCWELSDFTPLHDVLAAFYPCFAVSFDFYASLFAIILSEYTFHVTFSPFIAPRLNPLATTWLNKYGPFVQSLVIEIDLSRLGLGPSPSATALLPGIGRVQDLIFDFSVSQLKRPLEAPLETLILACRRFYGEREVIPKPHIGPVDKQDAGNTQNPSADIVDKSSKPSPSNISERISRAISPAPQDSFEQSVLITHNDTKSEFYTWDLDDDDEIEDGDDDDDDDEDGDMDADSSFESSYCSSLSSDSSSNADTSLAPTPSIPEETPFFCPDKHLSICNHLARLRNKVTSLRIVGFSDEYSRALIATIFPQAKAFPIENHSYRVAPSTLWPRLRGQKSWIDAGRGTLLLDDHEVIPEPCIFPEGLVQLPPPVIYRSGIRSLPWCREPTHRPRHSTTNSGSSWPSQRSMESNDGNISTSSQRSDEKSRMQKLLGKYKEKSRRRSRPISAP